MKKFIEIHTLTDYLMILNLDAIEEIIEDDDGGCCIFTNALPKDVIRYTVTPKESYQQIRSMIANIQGGFTVPPEMAKVGVLE